MNSTVYLLVLIGIIAIALVSVIASGQKKRQNSVKIPEILVHIEEAAQISKNWGLGSVCVACDENSDGFLLSFALTQDDMPKMDTIIYYEQENGWDLIHPFYSALPILAKQCSSDFKYSREDFFESLTKELSETHPDWQIIENHPYRIICF